MTFAETSRTTPPSTPRACRRVPTAPPPLRRTRADPLFLGLQQNCLKQVRLALEADSDAAKLPFWEPRFELPLCAAIRLGCSEEVIGLLLKHGAKVDVTDAKGQTPLQFLSSGVERRFLRIPPEDLRGPPGSPEWSERVRELTARFELGVATALLMAGADPDACDGGLGRGHHSSMELARRSGKDHLVGLYEAHGLRCAV